MTERGAVWAERHARSGVKSASGRTAPDDQLHHRDRHPHAERILGNQWTRLVSHTVLNQASASEERDTSAGAGSSLIYQGRLLYTWSNV